MRMCSKFDFLLDNFEPLRFFFFGIKKRSQNFLLFFLLIRGHFYYVRNLLQHFTFTDDQSREIRKKKMSVSFVPTVHILSPTPCLFMKGSTNRSILTNIERRTRRTCQVTSSQSQPNNPKQPQQTGNKQQLSLEDWHSWIISGNEQKLPGLPFTPDNVFLPGESKTLHLFEARNLSLFETSLYQHDKHFAHLLIDSNKRTMAAICPLLYITSWKRLSVGVSVTITGVGRLHATRLHKSSPFVTGDFTGVTDNAVNTNDEVNELKELEKEFWELVHGIVQLIKAFDGAEGLWREKEVDIISQATLKAVGFSNTDNSNNTINNNINVIDVDDVIKRINYTANIAYGHNNCDNIVDRCIGLSFAGWDLFPSTPHSRQKAIEQKCTKTRLSSVVDGLRERHNYLVARFALKSALS